MREIKFRAWSPKHGRMFVPGDNYTNVLVIRFDKEGSMKEWDIGQSDYEWDVNGANPWDFLPEEQKPALMQFTGLLDKEGVEIYEGDLVELDSTPSSKLEIVFHNGAFCIHGYNWNNKKCKVVGNIHEQ